MYLKWKEVVYTILKVNIFMMHINSFIVNYLDVSLPRNKINSLLVLLGKNGLKLNAVHVSCITNEVPLFIIHEVKFDFY